MYLSSDRGAWAGSPWVSNSFRVILRSGLALLNSSTAVLAPSRMLMPRLAASPVSGPTKAIEYSLAAPPEPPVVVVLSSSLHAAATSAIREETGEEPRASWVLPCMSPLDLVGIRRAEVRRFGGRGCRAGQNAHVETELALPARCVSPSRRGHGAGQRGCAGRLGSHDLLSDGRRVSPTTPAPSPGGANRSKWSMFARRATRLALARRAGAGPGRPACEASSTGSGATR